jgi:uncharacterized protein (DUF2384 family)
MQKQKAITANSMTARAVGVLGVDTAMRWLGRPIPALNYDTPISLLRSRSGTPFSMRLGGSNTVFSNY